MYSLQFKKGLLKTPLRTLIARQVMISMTQFPVWHAHPFIRKTLGQVSFRMIYTFRYRKTRLNLAMGKDGKTSKTHLYSSNI